MSKAKPPAEQPTNWYEVVYGLLSQWGIPGLIAVALCYGGWRFMDATLKDQDAAALDRKAMTAQLEGINKTNASLLVLTEKQTQSWEWFNRRLYESDVEAERKQRR